MSDNHKGILNSQYGSYWITNFQESKKWSDACNAIPIGWTRGRVIRNFNPPRCKKCNSPIRHVDGRLFCSIVCRHQSTSEQLADYIDATGEIPIGGSESTTTGRAKRYLLATCGRICSICQIETWTGVPVPLVLDHIDGHSDNWAIINLRLVCGNCDMLLPTYKAKNKGYGREWRRLLAAKKAAKLKRLIMRGIPAGS